MNQFQGKFLLSRIYSFVQWLEALIVLMEELISVLSVPLLSFGVVVSMIDFFQGGALSHNAEFSLAWAVIQAVSLDAQVAFTWHKARRAFHHKKAFAFAGFFFIGVMLAFVVWASSSLEGQHQIANNTESQTQIVVSHINPKEWPYGYSPSSYEPLPAPTQNDAQSLADQGTVSLLGINIPGNLLVSIRMGIAVILLCIAGWTRKLIAELDSTTTTVDTQETEKKPFWLTQKWTQLRASFAAKKLERKEARAAKKARKSVTKNNTDLNTDVSQTVALANEVCEQESVQQNVHERDTGELNKVNTNNVTKVFTDTDPELHTPVYTKVYTSKKTQPLPELHNLSQKSDTQSAAKSNTKRSRGDAYKRATRVLKRNPNITVPELVRKAEISRTYAIQILKENEKSA